MTARKPLVIGNWKMHTTRAEAITLATAIGDASPFAEVDVAVCPPYPWLEAVVRTLAGTSVALGAQDCSNERSGAFTGQVSAAMLKELCSLVIVGHSERRRDCGDSNDLIGMKAMAALDAGVLPVVCVGESIEIRNEGEAVSWVSDQISAVIGRVGVDRLAELTIAYEPIWAIGTGLSASADDAGEMASAIRKMIVTASPEAGDSVRILYGGSVNAENAAVYAKQPDVDGMLVGGASLKVESFLSIVSAC